MKVGRQPRDGRLNDWQTQTIRPSESAEGAVLTPTVRRVFYPAPPEYTADTSPASGIVGFEEDANASDCPPLNWCILHPENVLRCISFAAASAGLA